MADARRGPDPSALERNDYAIIREIYENDNSSEEFENELEKALEAQVQTIVIEPSKLGDETGRWISVGNCLHKTAVLSSLTCLSTGLTWPDRGYIYLPFGFVSVICAGVYAVSWQMDPCCKYQVEREAGNLQRLPLHQLTSSCPVVLVRKDDARRKWLHNTSAVLAAVYCGWRIYEWYLK